MSTGGGGGGGGEGMPGVGYTWVYMGVPPNRVTFWNPRLFFINLCVFIHMYLHLKP